MFNLYHTEVGIEILVHGLWQNVVFEQKNNKIMKKMTFCRE